MRIKRAIFLFRHTLENYFNNKLKRKAFFFYDLHIYIILLDVYESHIKYLKPPKPVLRNVLLW